MSRVVSQKRKNVMGDEIDELEIKKLIPPE